MKLVVLTKDGSRLMLDTLETPDYKEKYLQEDGTPFDSVPLTSGTSTEADEVTLEQTEVKPQKARKSKK